MKESDDIANLFKHFGGQAEQYQEIGRANEARQSRERWPLLSSIDAERAAQFPPVDKVSHGNEPSVSRPPRTEPPAPELSAFRSPGRAQRIEPRLSSPVEPAAPASVAAESSAPPAAPARPRAEFIPPRPGALRGRSLPPAFARPPGAPAPGAADAAPLPAPSDGPAAAPVARAADTGLHAVFARLAQPAPAAPAPAEDKNASLLQRLNRL